MRSPDLSTVKTVITVDAKHAAAMGAFPTFHLKLDERFFADRLNSAQILDHAHAVAGAITFVELFHARTGKFFTVYA